MRPSTSTRYLKISILYLENLARIKYDIVSFGFALVFIREEMALADAALHLAVFK
jgi:hypothetical protein